MNIIGYVVLAVILVALVYIFFSKKINRWINFRLMTHRQHILALSYDYKKDPVRGLTQSKSKERLWVLEGAHYEAKITTYCPDGSVESVNLCFSIDGKIWTCTYYPGIHFSPKVDEFVKSGKLQSCGVFNVVQVHRPARHKPYEHPFVLYDIEVLFA